MAVPTVASGCANSAKSGVEALEAGDYKEAQAQFEKLTEEKDKKKSAEGYRGLAMTYYEQEEYSSALDAFKKAVDTGVVQTTQIYNLMGVCARRQRITRRLLNIYRRVLPWRKQICQVKKRRIRKMEKILLK